MQELKTQLVTKGKIAEIFYSVQGEGIYIGLPQIFVRFYGCNLSCKFCDTQLTNFNKYTASELSNILSGFKYDFHSICFTGGEPLLQKDFLKEIFILTKNRNIKTYLETNGILPDELSQVIEHVDIIAMDWKLPTSTGLEYFRKQHIDFLRVALKREVFVKMVICHSSKDYDLMQAVELIASFRRTIPLILQPNYSELDNGLISKLKIYQQACLKYLSDVRVMPQAHKILGVK